jgi:hypothetical protein
MIPFYSGFSRFFCDQFSLIGFFEAPTYSASLRTGMQFQAARTYPAIQQFKHKRPEKLQSLLRHQQARQ